MTQEQLYQPKQPQKLRGDQGEDFALRFERQRLQAMFLASSIGKMHPLPLRMDSIA